MTSKRLLFLSGTRVFQNNFICALFRGYNNGRSLHGIKAVDIHCEVCDIYGEGQMSHRTVCRWVAFSAWQLLAQIVLQQLRPKVT